MNNNDKNKNLDDFISNTANKDNPITSNDNERAKMKYKSIRIHPEDYEVFREIAFKQRMSVVDLISEAKECILKKYGE